MGFLLWELFEMDGKNKRNRDARFKRRCRRGFTGKREALLLDTPECRIEY